MAVTKAKVNISQIAAASPLLLPDGSAVYPIRFRLTSDDKNRKSQWSAIYLVEAPSGYDVFFEGMDGGDYIGG